MLLKTFRLNLWVVSFIYGLSVFSAGLLWLITGRPFDKITYSKILGYSINDFVVQTTTRTNNLISSLIRFLGGNTGVILGIMIMFISLFSYRKHVKLAWYVLWIIPLHSIIDLILLIFYDAVSFSSFAFDLTTILVFTLIQIITFKEFTC